jgi:hypothetical protein
MARQPLSGLYVAEIKRKYKDRVYTSFLLRRSYREDGKVKQQTLANLSSLPPHAIAVLRDVLRGQSYLPQDQAFACIRTRAHGHVAAIRAMVERLELERILDPQPSRERELAVALIVARVAQPLTKLATTRWWQTTTLADDPVVAEATEDDLYATLDWLLERQPRIERRLARRHLQEGGLVLYDLSSSYVEGSHCPLAAFGHNRDKKRGRRQVNYGLVLDAEGRPVAIEVFPGNVGDARTLASQVEKLRGRFRLRHVVLVGDRGMLTGAQIRDLKAIGGMDWISALRAKEIQALAASGAIQLSLFDQRDLAEVRSPDFPGERLIVCRNPLLAEERAREREALLAATEKLLDRLQKRVASGRLKQQTKIGEALGRIKNRYKVGKHFDCVVAEGHFTYKRREESIRREAELDGIYVLRTSVPAETLTPKQTVLGYKRLARAERAFRTLKSVDLRVRPIHHWTAPRVRAHFLLAMLAYYVEWHLREAWKPFLFDDEAPGAHEGGSPVRPALRSPQARDKARTRQTPQGWPVHSFGTLLADLSTVARHTWRIPARPDVPPFTAVTVPTPFQEEVFRRVGLHIGATCRQNHPA